MGKLDAIVKKLQENLERAHRQLLQKEATLKETKAFLTTLLGSSHSTVFNVFNNCVAEWRWMPGMSRGFHLGTASP